MAYSKTTWQDNVTPASATNLNKLETQYEAAMAEIQNMLQSARNFDIYGGGNIKWGVTANTFAWDAAFIIYTFNGHLLPDGVAIKTINIAAGSVVMASNWNCAYITIPTTDNATVTMSVGLVSDALSNDKIILAVRDVNGVLIIRGGLIMPPGSTMDTTGKLDCYSKTAKKTASQLNSTTLASGLYTNSGDGILNNDGSVFKAGWFHVWQGYHWDNNGFSCQIAIPLSPTDTNPQTGGAAMFFRYATGTTWNAWRRLWDDTSDGAGSGLDADLFQGVLKHGLVPTGINLMTGADGDATISTDTAFPKNVMQYNNLTINAGVTFSAPSAGIWIISVKGTLTLNGVISGVGKGGAGVTNNYTTGGSGGGIIVVLANTITGSGQILVNGTNGGNGNHAGLQGYTQYFGTKGSIFGNVLNGGGNDSIQPGNCVGGSAEIAPTSMSALLQCGLFAFAPGDIGASGAAPGVSDNSTSNYYGHGGGGGAGCYGNGGNGGACNASASSTGGGGSGGGGGGFIYILSKNAVPAITLQANGGNGSNGVDYAGGGGGGGGGCVYICAPSSSASVSVSAGSGGAAGTSSNPGSAGSAGLSIYKTLV